MSDWKEKLKELDMYTSGLRDWIEEIKIDALKSYQDKLVRDIEGLAKTDTTDQMAYLAYNSALSDVIALVKKEKR